MVEFGTWLVRLHDADDNSDMHASTRHLNRLVRLLYSFDDFGLSLDPGGDPEGIITHLLVADYLLCHPKERLRYRRDQSGEVKYLDILAMAEKEARAGQAAARQ